MAKANGARQQPMPKAPRPATTATRKRLAAALAEIDAALPGSVVIRHMRCGKSGCRCKADPPSLHGPYIQWTRSVQGKTVTRFLTQEQFERYRPWFNNAKRLRELLNKLETQTLKAVESAEGWTNRT
jgi:hypothetical protein